MKQGIGRPVYSGVSIGRIYLYKPNTCDLTRPAEDPKAELEAFHQAKVTAAEQIAELYEKTLREIGEEQAQIIEIQGMMMDDADYVEAVEDMIQNGSSAASAVHETGDAFAAVFAAMDDEYMQARSTDVRDISERLVRILCGGSSVFHMEDPGILVADDLTPSETVQLDKEKVLAFVTRQGSSSSHTAILARILNIPSLVQADIVLDDDIDGRMMAVDGFTGEYYIDPDEETLTRMEDKQHRVEEYRQLLEGYRGKPSVTAAGRKIKLFANIGSPDDVQRVIDGDGEGIGLLRSEFLYLGREDYPTEQELYEAYRKVVEAMDGKTTVIRTLDIGADKKVDYFGLEEEENPALGYRGIRICLTREEVFRPQMRAIYRAAAHGPISVMFPMIISEAEVLRIRAFCEKIKEELKEEGIPYGETELGIMIETPAAAIISDRLAKLVDFFSVGTNDLTQYTLAIDRQNAKLDSFYDAHHPAVLALLEMVARNAHANGIWAGICGELAGDLELTDTFLKMGFDELSVSPSRILELRKKVCESQVG